MKKKVFSFWKWLKADKKRIVIAVGMLSIFVFAVGYLIYNSTKSKTQYQTALVEKGNIVSTVSVSGSVVTANLFNITTSATGVVKAVYVKDEDKVSSGQKIAEIILDASGSQASSQAYAAYLSAKNSVDSAVTSLWTLQSQAFAANQKFINDAAARNLATNDPTYIQEWADWKAAEEKYNHQSDVINQSKISLNNAWLNYKDVSPVIYAPSTGTVTNLSITEGLSLNSADQKVGIIKIAGNPLASFNVSEIDIPKIKVGQKATITLDSLSDKTFTGRVMTVDKTGATTSGVTNYPVIIRFDTEANDLLPSMSATANIILETKNDVLLVPSSAVRTQNGESTITILKNGKEQTVNVTVGISSDTQIEIVSGVNEGDTVVTSANATTTTQNNSRSIFSGGFGGGGATRIIGR